MLAGYFHDGDMINENLRNLFSNKDIKVEPIYDENDKKTEDNKTIVNFVGFITDNKNRTYVSFPKHFSVNNLQNDARLIFNCIQAHRQRNPSLYFGKFGMKIYDSSYPFAFFYNIYDYFNKYGLYRKIETKIKSKSGGKINWKSTINKGRKFIINNNYIPFPIYYNNKQYLYNFVTKCMIYVIDYTIDTFPFLVNKKKTGEPFPNDNLFLKEENKSIIIHNLRKINSITFKDHEKELINNLILFFLSLKKGGKFYLKHYNFSIIWENMVEKYLDRYFQGVDTNKNNRLIFSQDRNKKYKFKKITFHPNLANKKQSIQPDHYYEDEENRYIFDAKYYNQVLGINYKQVSYVFFLRDYVGNKSTSISKKTYSSLILPFEKRKTKIHFKMNPRFSKLFEDMIIGEEYLDIREVIETYLD